MRVTGIILLCLFTVMTGCQKSEWTRYDSEAGRFSVLFPGPPETREAPLDTEVGQLTLYATLYEQRDKVFTIMYGDYPESFVTQSDPADILEGGVEGMVASKQGTKLQDRNISIDGYPGREIVYRNPNPDITVKARLFMVQNRLYMVMQMTRSAQFSHHEADKFLDSFTLK